MPNHRLSIAFMALVAAASIAAPGLAAEAQPFALKAPFALKDKDTVVFYGDSITEQNRYTQWVELYTVTRFPGMHVRFVTSGVGGDKVSGGGGGPIEKRLERDLFAYKPSVVTIMLGMNDGQYRTPDDGVTAAYTSGYEHILGEIASRAAGARVTLIGPSAFDDITRPVWFPGGYNQVIRNFSAIDARLAAEHGLAYVDFNAPVAVAVQKEQAIDPQVARLLLPDRVHPEVVPHWIMAASLLKSWNAPALVSSVSLDAGKAKIVSADNATVSGVTRSATGLQWTALEKALPLPLDANNETFALLFSLSDIQSTLNDEQLKVAGLAPGSYTLSIDGKTVTTVTDTQLSAGINLADYHTPMRDQAQQASWLVRDRTEARYIRLRMQVNETDLGTPDAIEALDARLEADIYRVVQPVAHSFALAKVP